MNYVRKDTPGCVLWFCNIVWIWGVSEDVMGIDVVMMYLQENMASYVISAFQKDDWHMIA